MIPARYASTRLPGKPLALIGDKPMIEWVYEKAIAAPGIDRVVVATDDERIAEVVHHFRGEVVLTDAGLASGTDRVAAVARNMDADVVINLQGDEPFVEPDLLSRLAAAFADPAIDMATPVKKISSEQDLHSADLVRVVRDIHNFALYFTRAVIPYVRDRSDWLKHHEFFKHIGIYAYRKEFLLKLSRLPVSSLEKAEKLEQLRVLENGFRIFTIETEYESVSVDTPEDLLRVNKLLKQKN